MKRVMKHLINRVLLWYMRGTCVTEWHQEENTIHLTLRGCGLFKMYTGKPAFCDIDIDPALVIQSPQ